MWKDFYMSGQETIKASYFKQFTIKILKILHKEYYCNINYLPDERDIVKLIVVN